MRTIANNVFYLSALVLVAGVMMFAVTGMASADDDWLTRDRLREAADEKAKACYNLDTEISIQLQSLYSQRVNEYTRQIAEIYHHYCKR
jgi:hypothetical protein